MRIIQLIFVRLLTYVLTEYTHDMQGRLTKINDPDNPAGASATRWIHHSGSTQTYVYNYDQHSRLISGVHSGSNNEQAISYDSNGNVTSLTRTGTQPAVMSYSYSENRIASVTRDGITHPYTHDSNGNVTTDGIRGMNIDYNHLDLPVTVAKGQDTLKYIYDAQGTKLATAINDTIINYYTGMVVYRDDKSMDYIINSTGMIRKQGQQYVRQYNITDHLGSTRAVVDQSANVIQATDYYPYGLPFQYNSLEKNRYLYNNKEIQNQSLGSVFLGTYDYGARFYDPELGRWHSVDPMAEKYYTISPYVYVGNNPIRFIDPNGMAPKEYDVDKNSGQIKQVSDKGGNTTDYFNIGTTNGAGNFVADRTISTERGGGTINTFRFSEDSRGTVSSFVIPRDGKDISGFLLEPSGPSTTVSGTDKRIPEGQFSLTPNKGSRFPNAFRLFNDEVPSSRAILFHGGNFNDQTEGCLLPGCGIGIGKEGQSGITKPDQIQQRVGFLRTLSSRPKLNQMNNFINESGHENVKVNINNVID